MTSFNRNFPRRNDGNPDTLAFIASPEIVAAYAVAGRLSFNPLADALSMPGGRSLPRCEPPGSRARPAPRAASSRDASGYIAPPPDGEHGSRCASPRTASACRSSSRSLRGTAADFVELPLLLKARGKCTTDHISPAGPWLRFRGHLDHISDNMFTGAVNAFTGEPATTRNLLTGERGQGRSARSRAPTSAAGLRWVVVGDENYGEGSSREHAAMSPRLLGAAAVIARSFARIHESNLKKQGLLPLTFADPADYDAVRETDRISLHGLARARRRPVARRRCCTTPTAPEEPDRSCATRSTPSRSSWFRAGSALNVLKRQKA